MRQRMQGLGRRLLAYALIVVALVVLLRVVIHAVTGFVHLVVLVALLVFALYALNWGMRNRRG
jgi:hypothetical protein